MIPAEFGGRAHHGGAGSGGAVAQRIRPIAALRAGQGEGAYETVACPDLADHRNRRRDGHEARGQSSPAPIPRPPWQAQPPRPDLCPRSCAQTRRPLGAKSSIRPASAALSTPSSRNTSGIAPSAVACTASAAPEVSNVRTAPSARVMSASVRAKIIGHARWLRAGQDHLHVAFYRTVKPVAKRAEIRLGPDRAGHDEAILTAPPADH